MWRMFILIIIIHSFCQFVFVLPIDFPLRSIALMQRDIKVKPNH